MTDYKNAVEINAVTKKYAGFAIENVSFNVPKGSITGLIGRSGSGKTTIIRSMLNITDIDKGEIRLLGLDHIRDEKKIKQRISVVGDELPFHNIFKIKDMARIFDGLYIHWNNQAFKYFLERFGLSEKKKIGELSQDMKMKLQIACALSHKAEVLIMDESMTGFEPVVRDEILNILIEYMQYEQCSILISSDINKNIERITDRVTYMDNGKILFSGYRDELLYHHCIVKCNMEETKKIDPEDIVSIRVNADGAEALIKNRESVQQKYRNMMIQPATLDQIMMFYANKGKRRWS